MMCRSRHNQGVTIKILSRPLLLTATPRFAPKGNYVVDNLRTYIGYSTLYFVYSSSQHQHLTRAIATQGKLGCNSLNCSEYLTAKEMQEIQQMQEMQESAIDVNSQAAAVAAATGSESDTEPVSNVLEKQKPNENNDNEAGEADDGNGGEGEVENDAAVKVEGVMFVEGWWMYQLLGEGAFGE